MEDFQDPPFSMCGLFCHENESCLNEDYFDQDDDIVDQCSISVSDDDDDYIDKLFQKEAIFVSNSTNASVADDDCSIENDQSWLKRARSDAIQWILNTRAFFGFHFRTAYLSLIYFDLFFSKRSIDREKIWAVRLLSVACLSLAAKMEELKVPALSQYHVDEYNFKSSVIQRMELLVLSTLEWKMNLITPFAHLHYFITKFSGESRPKGLVSRAINLILVIVKDVNLVVHRPSVIAAAAVLAASDCQLTRKILEFKTTEISSWGPLEKESMLSCYNLMQEKEILRSKTTPNSLISPTLLITKSSCTEILESSSITSAVGTKRRLVYSEYCDQHCPPPKIHRFEL